MWNTIKHNVFQLLLVIDQLFNVVLCMCLFWNEKVWADESLSSHAWRWEQKGKRSWPRKLIDKVMFWDKNHCENAYKSEVNQMHLSPEQRVENANYN